MFDEKAVIKAVLASGYSADNLPYSPRFDSVHQMVGNGHGKDELAAYAIKLRKQNKLPTPRKKRPFASLVAFKSQIAEIAGRHNLPPRDHAAYTIDYEAFADEVFRLIPSVKRSGPHVLWCNVMAWSKQGQWIVSVMDNKAVAFGGIQPSGKVLDIPTGTLVVDPAYQRWIAQDHKNLLREVFDPNLCGTIHVGKRSGDDSYYVIDGQRRLFIATNCGITHLPCYVIPSSGRKFEADLFLSFNEKRKKISQPANLFAAAAAGSEIALGITAMLDQHGFSLATHGERKWPFIISVSALRRAYSAGVLPTLLRTLKAFEGSDALVRHKAVSGYTVDALSTLLVLAKQAHDDFKRPLPCERRLFQVLNEQLMTFSKQAVVGPGGGRAIPMAALLAQHYNTGLKAKNEIGLVVKGQLWTPRPTGSKKNRTESVED